MLPLEVALSGDDDLFSREKIITKVHVMSGSKLKIVQKSSINV